jgi:hypothetical protein
VSLPFAEPNETSNNEESYYYCECDNEGISEIRAVIKQRAQLAVTAGGAALAVSKTGGFQGL